jgi:hypothetical protein
MAKRGKLKLTGENKCRGNKNKAKKRAKGEILA